MQATGRYFLSDSLPLGIDMTPTDFEKHSGMAASKKWKYTIRVLGAGGLQASAGGNSMTLGQWLDDHDIVSKYTK
jgi:hypothetical protein